MTTYSHYQQAVFQFVQQGEGNAIVEAVAGSGKTTTLVQAVQLAQGSSVFLAFNKSIATELKSRGVNARTFHSLCYSPVLKAVGAHEVDTNKLKRICNQNLSAHKNHVYSAFIIKLVGLARQVGIGCLVPNIEAAWLSIITNHNLEPDNELAELGEAVTLASQLLTWSNETGACDFDDLLYLSVKHGVRLPQFDYVFVDEAQDTNAIQRAILRKIMKPTSRLIAVGDPAQAIYGFRGADSDSLNLIASEFNCIRLPLSITYRCPTKVVKHAQQWVQHLEAADGAAEGEVTTLQAWNEVGFNYGDLIVCRTTKPLVKLAFRLITNRIPATVMGREIGQGLKGLIIKMKANDLEQLEANLENYLARETQKAIAKMDDSKAEAVRDRVECITTLIEMLPEDNRTIGGLYNVIDEIFTDNGNAVTLATIHKSKGLEADRVFWLEYEQCPPRWVKGGWQLQQEYNLCYVATTRAKKSLYLLPAI